MSLVHFRTRRQVHSPMHFLPCRHVRQRILTEKWQRRKIEKVKRPLKRFVLFYPAHRFYVILQKILTTKMSMWPSRTDKAGQIHQSWRRRRLDDDNDGDDGDDDELWPTCKGNYPSTHCFICAAKDGRQFLDNPSSCECGMEAYKSNHKICYKCAKESNEQKDCSNIGCDKKRHLILTTCKNHHQRADTEVVACKICGEARSLQVR